MCFFQFINYVLYNILKLSVIYLILFIKNSDYHLVSFLFMFLADKVFMSGV